MVESDYAANENKKPCRSPGEITFCIFFIVVGGFAYYIALSFTSGTWDSPSIFPRLVSALIVVLSIVTIFRTIKNTVKPSFTSMKDIAKFLLPADVAVLLFMLTVYSVVLPIIHFIPASFLFMYIAMVYLQRGRGLLKSAAISGLALACLVAIFRYIFLVILP